MYRLPEFSVSFEFLLASIFILAMAGSANAVTKGSKETPERPNILFIAIDDLRPELGCYGSDLAITPHLDKLASEGVLFERAYCQQAICSPSRASIMTGARPDTIGVIENYTYFRDANPDIVTLPQHLIAHGYETVNIGKIYHGRFNDPEKSWSRQPVKGVPGVKRPVPYALKENMDIMNRNRAEAAAKYSPEARAGLGNGPAYEATFRILPISMDTTPSSPSRH